MPMLNKVLALFKNPLNVLITAPNKKETKKIAITDIPTTQPIAIKLNKKINYLIPKSI